MARAFLTIPVRPFAAALQNPQFALLDRPPRSAGWVHRSTNRSQAARSRTRNGMSATAHNREIPIVWYFTGFHTDYTSPSDTADKINFEKLTRITQHIANFSYEIANNQKLPVFDKNILSAPEGDFSR